MPASRPGLFLVYVFAINSVILAAFVFLFRFPNASASWNAVLATILFFERYLIDVLIIASVGSILINAGLLARIVCYTITFVHLIANALQLTAYFTGGEFISRLAIENSRHISLVLRPSILAGVGLWLTLFAALPCLSWHRSPAPWRPLLGTCAFGITLCFGLITSSNWLPTEANRIRDQFFADNNITRHSPLTALHRVLLNREVVNFDAKLTSHDLQLATSFGFEIKPDQPYPLIKDWIYKSPPPFAPLANAPAKPNIIIFFTEGFSARPIGSYGGKIANLTPGIDAFAAHPQTMQVEGYFSHTAATYRGIHGQLCSMFPKAVGDGRNRETQRLLDNPNFCLSHYLNETGYRTFFLDSEREDATGVAKLARTLGFSTVLTAKDLSLQFLGNAEPLRTDALSDQQFLRAFTAFLRTKAETKPNEPWFVSLYNLETHALLDIGSDGVIYQDGDNNSLNTIHNYDAAFGAFWHAFLKSPLAANTIIILTADHARYPEKSFVNAITPSDPTYQRIFFDRIPLIIYDPTRTLPATFNANYRSSLDLAPTLIHLLGLPNRKNPFLGTSLFDPQGRTRAAAVYSMGEKLYIASKDGIAPLAKNPAAAVGFEHINKILHYVKSLEANNRIWKDQNH
jgi:hypothetical protein